MCLQIAVQGLAGSGMVLPFPHWHKLSTAESADKEFELSERSEFSNSLSADSRSTPQGAINSRQSEGPCDRGALSFASFLWAHKEKKLPLLAVHRTA